MQTDMKDRLRGLLLKCGININTTSIADQIIADGWLRPPCKVGDRVYSISAGDKKTLKIWIEPNGDKITQIKINRGGYHFKCWWGYFHLSDIGKTIFLTKEQAEQKLKEMRKDNS